MQTYLQLKQKIRREIWPSGEPASLRTAHDGHFKAAMMDLQKWIECLRMNNVSTFSFDNTFWHDGKTVVNAPFGEIRRVYTVANAESDPESWRDIVTYKSATIDEINCWSKRLFDSTAPTITVGEEMELGYRKSDASSDSQFGRARVGIFSIYRKRLYVAPWVQSNELIVVDWDGEKNDWSDTDVVDETYWTVDVEEAIAYYVKFKHEMFYGDKSEAAVFKQAYDDKLSDLIWKCREYTRKKPTVACDAGADGELTGLTQDEVDDDVVPGPPVDEDAVLFDFVGDVEETPEGEALAAAVESDNPEFLVLGGDIGYHADNGGYAAALSPMYDWAKDAGIIKPVIGNHEYDGDADLSEYFDFFADELEDATPNQRYYEFTHGSVHGFVENRNPEEVNGFDTTSSQNGWIIAKAYLSTARWKFAFGHQPAYSSGSTYGSDTDLQRDYAGAGIQAVFSAHEHNAEHVIVNGVHYFNCGLGGRSRYDFGAPITGSQFRYNAKETRIRVTLDCDECLVEFVTSDGETVYSYTITHD